MDEVVMNESKYSPPDVSETPWLIFTHTNNRKILEKQTFCTISPLLSENPSYIKKIVELNGKFILGSSLGWLILQEREYSVMYSLWNPVTLQSILLPELLDAPDEQPTCVLTSAPDDDFAGNPSCVLLLFFEGLVFFCKPMVGDGCLWVKQSLKHGDKSMLISDVVTVNEGIYAFASCKLTDDGGFDSIFFRIKVANDNSNSLLFELSLLEHPEKSIKFKVCPIGFNYLVESCGVLYAIHIMIRQFDGMYNCDIYKALVWRLDMSQMDWIQVESLEDRAFLLCNGSSTWCCTRTSRSGALGTDIEGDCIYLALPGCQNVHLYRLRDDTCTLLLPHPNFQHFDGPTWFMPNHHIRFSPDQEEKIKNVSYVKCVDDLKEEMMMTKSIQVWSQLQSDMMTLITKRMHLLDRMNFRATCKVFHSMTPAIKWKDGCSFPLFMSLKNKKDTWKVEYPCDETIFHTINTPYPPSFITTLDFYKDGWLLLRGQSDSLQYCNPFTKEKGEYPPTRFASASYAFSTRPNSCDCVTVGIHGFEDVTISCFQASTKNWTYHHFETTNFQANYNSSAKYISGAFYFISVEGNIGVFKMEGGEWNWEVSRSPLTEEACESLNSCYLVELDDYLISVFIQQVGKRVQVFKFDTFERRWEEMDNLGKYVLFLSPASSFSIMEKDNTKRNRIYLPKRIGDGFVYYSLDTSKYHTTGKEDYIDFYGMRAEQLGCWI